MGFHKRHIDQILTKKYLFEGKLKNLYKADLFFFEDKISSEIYELYIQGISIDDLKKIYEKNSSNL